MRMINIAIVYDSILKPETEISLLQKSLLRTMIME